MRCSARQVSLVYVTVDTIHINATALHHLGLSRDQVVPLYKLFLLLLPLNNLLLLLLLLPQVKCRYKYVKLKTGDTYEFLPAEEVGGMEARLSPDYNAVSVTCRRVGPPFLLVLN